MIERLRQLFLGRSKDVDDPGVFHRMALIPFLAWVGLGADGLSSSAYGPDEAFRALGEHRYLALALAVATAFTVLVISYAYSLIIEQFPGGGGGYVVATKMIGERAGVLSGCALLVDYVLTITVSVASGCDAVFSFLPPEWRMHKLAVELGVMALLVVLNLRGVKESVQVLMPIFMLFLLTHAVLIGVGVVGHIGDAHLVAREATSQFHADLHSVGAWGLFLLFLRAYSLGGGTYTGIEAVSNGLNLLREPRVENGKRTMVYMATSLAITAGGIIVCYLLVNVHPVPHCQPEQACWKTLNALLAEGVAGHWPGGRAFIITTLVCEASLLFVAAQAGFIGGPRVIANMASDSWMPHRFAALSDRLTTENGVLLIGAAATAILLYAHGSVDKLVVMYSINVFLTFSLSEFGMVRYWREHREDDPRWRRYLLVFGTGLVLCVSILAVTVVEKFREGGWLTLVITACTVLLCLLIREHYDGVRRSLQRLDQLFANLPISPSREANVPVDPTKPTAALLVGGYGGLGVHSVLTLLKMFPNQFSNLVFVSVGVVDSGNFKGAREVDALKARSRESLEKYVGLARKIGMAATYRFDIGIEVVDEASRLCLDVTKEFPNTIFFAGKLIFERRRWYHRILHNETAYAIQHRLQFAGYPMVILPVRVREQDMARDPQDRSTQTTEK